MPSIPSLRSRWAVRLAGVFLLAILGWALSPHLFSSSEEVDKTEKAEILRPELALVPPDSFLFVHLRIGDVWDHPLIARARKVLVDNKLLGDKGEIKMDLPLQLADLESLTFVIPSAKTLLDKVIQPEREAPARTVPQPPDNNKDGGAKDPLLDLESRPKKDVKPTPPDSKKNGSAKDPYKEKEKSQEKIPDDEKPKVKEKSAEVDKSNNDICSVCEQPPEKDKDKEKLAEKEKLPDSPKGIEFKTEGKFSKPGDLPPMFLVVTTKAPCPQDKVMKFAMGGSFKEEKYNGKTYANGTFGICAHFVNEQTFLMASSATAMKMLLDRPQQVKAEGPQAGALNLANNKHHLVVSVNLTEPACVEFKKNIAQELKQADQGGGDPLEAPTWLLFPLLETLTANLTVDLNKESRVKVQAGLTFPDAERAADAVGALQDILVLGRVFTLGRFKHMLAAEAAELDEGGFKFEMFETFTFDRQDLIFATLLMKQAEAALRGATVERRQAAVRFQAEGQFDIDYLRGKAKIAAANFVVDEAGRQARFKRQSINNLKQMALAQFSFQDAYKSFPPAAICSKKDGTPLLSWRVAILPFIEEQPLFQEFKLDEPWDSPHNIKLLPRMPKIYAPVGGIKTKDPYTTFYQVFVGEGTAYELFLDKDAPLGARGPRFPADFQDGTSNTIGIVEAGVAVPWSKPADLPYSDKKPLPKIGGTLFPDGFNCSMMDGSARFVKMARPGVSPMEAARRHEVSEQTIRYAIGRADGMPLGIDW